MASLRKSFELSTAFNDYTLSEQIGEGGAGRVFGATDAKGAQYAIKVLTQSSSDAKRRFRNEISFLFRHKHPNLLDIVDHGVASQEKLAGPFYVMPRYDQSLRSAISAGIPKDRVLPMFSQILDGVEAAHLKGTVHRDLKPENILQSISSDFLVIADFGIASFRQEEMQTFFETADGKRLANFEYAAPEQRSKGREVGTPADIYALGLILNEMFTSHVPHGSNYQKIVVHAPDFSFLDQIIDAMIAQDPASRPRSIMDIKQLIRRYQAEAVSVQKISAISNSVVKAGEIDNPLAFEPPKLIDATWNSGVLTLVLDRPVNSDWVEALHNMGSFTSVMGIPPHLFNFGGDRTRTSVSVQESGAQGVINYFKQWLPQATRVLNQILKARAERKEAEEREALRIQRETEERNLRVNKSLVI